MLCLLIFRRFFCLLDAAPTLLLLSNWKLAAPGSVSILGRSLISSLKPKAFPSLSRPFSLFLILRFFDLSSRFRP